MGEEARERREEERQGGVRIEGGVLLCQRGSEAQTTMETLHEARTENKVTIRETVQLQRGVSGLRGATLGKSAISAWRTEAKNPYLHPTPPSHHLVKIAYRSYPEDRIPILHPTPLPHHPGVKIAYRSYSEDRTRVLYYPTPILYHHGKEIAHLPWPDITRPRLDHVPARTTETTISVPLSLFLMRIKGAIQILNQQTFTSLV